jgi:ankyrin repeat protein
MPAVPAGWDAFKHATNVGDVDAMRQLLDPPCAATALLRHARTHADVLASAAEAGNVDVLRCLIDHPSADPAAMLRWKNVEGEDWTALEAASFFGNVNAVRYLLDHPSANHDAAADAAALIYAAESNNVPAMRLLLDRLPTRQEC